ncbi:MAG: M28 family peptidase [Saprospiraceae bacterium]|nr:M28 family peptidase [Saprospiraceae bacterium]
MTDRSKSWRVLGLLLLSLFFSLSFSIKGQVVEQELKEPELVSHLRFLSSDELRGRKTGELSNWVAARYIAEELRKYGIKPGSGPDYFQVIPFGTVIPAERGILTFGGQTFSIDKDLLVRLAPISDMNGEVVFLTHALPDEVTANVKGKLVLAYLGGEDEGDPLASFGLTVEKKKKLKEMGALGLVEIYNGRHPWNLIKRYLGTGRMVVLDQSDDPEFPTLLVNGVSDKVLENIKSSKSLDFSLETDGTRIIETPSPNVVGILEGTDPKLKGEYIALTAHFDHVGTYTSRDRPATQKDSIFNGARDNAFGVSALLAAAQSLGEVPPKRSILFIAFTGEEIGLVGSRYYTDHPTIPLSQIIFNLNTDGAGNSDSTIVSVMGLNRVGAKEEIDKGCEEFGLTTFADPAPEQNLFDRSDNVSFAAKGIPAPTFSPGFKQFDNDILKHYHQPSDEAETIDLNYFYKFCQAYAYTARLIADKSSRPKWSGGDKYESAFLELYGTQK